MADKIISLKTLPTSTMNSRDRKMKEIQLCVFIINCQDCIAFVPWANVHVQNNEFFQTDLSCAGPKANVMISFTAYISLD